MMLQDHDWCTSTGPAARDRTTRGLPQQAGADVLADGRRHDARSASPSDGGYSGEMVARRAHDGRDPPAVHPVRGARPRRSMWWMLARLVSRRVAWLALLVVGSTPFFCLIARQGIPDMPLCAMRDGRDRDVHDGDRGRRPADRRRVVLRSARRVRDRRAPRRARARRRLRRRAGDLLRRATSSRRRARVAIAEPDRASRCSWRSFGCRASADACGSLLVGRDRACAVAAALLARSPLGATRRSLRRRGSRSRSCGRSAAGRHGARRRSPARHGAAHDDAPGLPARVLRAARRQRPREGPARARASSALVGVLLRRRCSAAGASSTTASSSSSAACC